MFCELILLHSYLLLIPAIQLQPPVHHAHAEQSLCLYSWHQGLQQWLQRQGMGQKHTLQRGPALAHRVDQGSNASVIQVRGRVPAHAGFPVSLALQAQLPASAALFCERHSKRPKAQTS